MEAQEALLGFFKALGDESRLRIVGFLAASERNVQELAAMLELREPTVSHHLARLRSLDLVRLRVDGNTHWYRLNHEVLRRMSREVFRPGNLTMLAGRPQGDGWERKVLSNFLDGERLREIPASRKKRWAILKWLAGSFAPGREYTEAETSRLIKRHHEDAATLRREMIGYRMLERRKGVYRLMPESGWRPAPG